MCDGADHRSGRTSRARPPLPGSGKASCSPGECPKTKIAEGEANGKMKMSGVVSCPISGKGHHHAPLTLGGEGEAGLDILGRKVWEVIEDFSNGHPGRQVG